VSASRKSARRACCRLRKYVTFAEVMRNTYLGVCGHIYSSSSNIAVVKAKECNGSLLPPEEVRMLT
jgi:hypothetical protein